MSNNCTLNSIFPEKHISNNKNDRNELINDNKNNNENLDHKSVYDNQIKSCLMRRGILVSVHCYLDTNIHTYLCTLICIYVPIYTQV
jgi:hypothetical protein